MNNSTHLESIPASNLDNVCGGKMSGRELLCRGGGAALGTVLGGGSSVIGGMSAGFGVGAGLMEAAAGASLVGGMVNSAGASSTSESVADTMLGVAGAIPVIGAPFAAYTGGKLGWKAGGAACGYGWTSRS